MVVLSTLEEQLDDRERIRIELERQLRGLDLRVAIGVNRRAGPIDVVDLPEREGTKGRRRRHLDQVDARGERVVQ